MEPEPSAKSKNNGKSVNHDSIVRIVEKINYEYAETLKKLAEIERQEKAGEKEK